MLKDYLSDHGLSVYQMSKDLHIPYSTLNDLSNAKTDIENLRFGMVKRMATYLDVSLDELVSLCGDDELQLKNRNAKILVKNKSYYLAYEPHKPLHQDTKTYYICKVNESNREYVTFLAEHMIQKIKQKTNMERAWTETFS